MAQHVAFLVIPASGHINPTLPLVAELLKRGYRVTYATGPAFRSPVEAAGASFVELDWVPKAIKVSPDGQTTEELAEMLLGFVGSARRVMPAVEEWLTTDRPDLFCYDMMTFIGPMLAEKLGLREATTGANFAGNDHFSLGSAVVPPDFDPSHPKFQEFLAARAAFARDFGVPVDKVAAAGAVAPLNLVFIPREFQFAGETFDERFHFVGPAIGEQVELESLGELLGNFDVRPWFPQPAVLEHAKVFLSHAGMNSVMEALLNQVPLATFPQTPEQHANARRVAELGLGRTVEGELSADSLRRLVDNLATDATVRFNLAEMSAHVRAAGGPAAAADAIERYLKA